MICIPWQLIAYYTFCTDIHQVPKTCTHYSSQSKKSAACLRYLHGYCTSNAVRMNFENFSGGISTVSAVTSKSPYQGSSNHYNSFLKVISVWVTCTMQVLNNVWLAIVSHIIMWIQELCNSNTQHFSQRCENRAFVNFYLDAHSNYCSISIAFIPCYMQALFRLTHVIGH